MDNKNTMLPVPSCSEMESAHKWVQENIADTYKFPFSFIYGGKESQSLVTKLKIEKSKKELCDNRTGYTITFTDPDTGLEVRCETVQYLDFPTVEWTVYFRNTGCADTPIIQDIQAIDVNLENKGNKEFLLHHFTGSPCRADDYKPYAAILKPNTCKSITTSGGRPTNSDMPYFNVETSAGGLIVVLSWAGQWKTDFIRDSAKRMQIRSGQELTHFKLYPGEEVRGPMAVLQFYEGDWIRAQNIWRRWMLQHNLPKPGGKPLKPQSALVTGNFFEGLKTNAEGEKTFIRRYAEEGVVPDYWWQDAGWYPCSDWTQTGTWDVDKERFPNGLKDVGDYGRRYGIKTLVWFEPERVAPGSWLYENRSEWLLEVDNDNLPERKKNSKLLNLGDTECRNWLIEKIDSIINEEKIDLYRQDFNIDPLPFWRRNDSEERQGITEIYYIMGYFAFWDELLLRHPAMLIDSCASGGRRNDLETLRRALPLLRSDYVFEPVANQCHTHSLSLWFPYYGTGAEQVETYMIRSVMCPHFSLGFDVRRYIFDYPIMKKEFENWKKIADYMLGDYYPLTSYSLENSSWIAWQFDRPDMGGGVIQVFRRSESPYESAIFKVNNLDVDVVYAVTDLDTGSLGEMTGKKLMEEGISIALAKCPDSALIVYKVKKV